MLSSETVPSHKGKRVFVDGLRGKCLRWMEVGVLMQLPAVGYVWAALLGREPPSDRAAPL
jgi:hypothetical protein